MRPSRGSLHVAAPEFAAGAADRAAGGGWAVRRAAVRRHHPVAAAAAAAVAAHRPHADHPHADAAGHLWRRAGQRDRDAAAGVLAGRAGDGAGEPAAACAGGCGGQLSRRRFQLLDRGGSARRAGRTDPHAQRARADPARAAPAPGAARAAAGHGGAEHAGGAGADRCGRSRGLRQHRLAPPVQRRPQPARAGLCHRAGGGARSHAPRGGKRRGRLDQRGAGRQRGNLPPVAARVPAAGAGASAAAVPTHDARTVAAGSGDLEAG